MPDSAPDWTTFDAWSDYRRSGASQFCPFWNEPLTPETRFLYYGITPPPISVSVGLDSACPTWRILAAQLRHDVLPECYFTYVSWHEWTQGGQPQAGEEILRGAPTATLCWRENLPVMQAVMLEVDKALAAADEAAGWPHLVEACRIFNRDWRTSGWSFELRIFPKLKAVMEDLGRVENGAYVVDDPNDPNDLTLLAQRCFEDPEANRRLRQYLAEFVRL